VRAPSRGIALTAFTLIAWAAMASPAQAHALLVRSDPADGGVLPVAPSTVNLWFSEDIAPDFSSAQLLDASGQAIPAAHVVPDPGDPRHLALGLPTIGSGAYAVMWQVLAEDDAHTTSGVMVFSVGATSAPAVATLPTTASASPLDTALRWIRICLLALIVGGLGMVFLVLGRAGDADRTVAASITSARRRVLIVVLGAACLAVAVGVAVLFAEARGLSGTAPSTDPLERLLTSTRSGHLWLTREVVLLVIAGVTLSMLRRTRDRSRSAEVGLRFGAAALVLVVVAIEALGSHAASSSSGYATALVADSVHVLTALLWLGALPALVLVLWPASDEHAGRADLIRACKGPFSRLAAASVLLIIVTGLYSAGREVETTNDLFDTLYGRILLVKGALLLVVGGIGLVNSARLHGWHPSWIGPARRLLGRPPSRRLIAAEVAVGAVLLLAAGLLADTPPALANRSPAVPAATEDLYGSVDDLVVSVSVTPNRPGVNGFTVVVASSRRPPPAPVDGVGLALVRSGSGLVPLETAVRLREVQAGRYFGSTRIAAPGPWRLTAVIRRAGDRFHVPLRWSVAAATPQLGIAPEGRRLAPIANAVAASLFGLAAAVALGLTARRRIQKRGLVHHIAADLPRAVVNEEIEQNKEAVPT
jgi:copper transport protein